jgi:hypothetical protein
VLQKFFELYGRLGSGSRHEYDPADGKGTRLLTNSAAVIFCHHNAPIHRIISLAHKLTDKPKDIIRELRQPGDYCAYQALESFDHLGEDPNNARGKLVKPLRVGPEALLLRGEDMGAVHDAITALQAGLAKSRLHDVLALLYRDGDVAAGIAAGKKAIARADDDTPGTQDAFESLRSLSANAVPKVTQDLQGAIAWLHAGELWDYIRPITWQAPPTPAVAGRTGA